VYGAAVVEQVQLASAEPTAATTVQASYGSLSEPMVRLGVATWLHRWWPSGNPALAVTFSVALLELEIGALRWLAEQAFIETSVIDRVLRPHAETLHSSYDWNRYSNAGFGQEVVDEVLTTALRGLVDTVPETVPGYQECADLLDSIDSGSQLSPDDWRLFAELLEAQQETLVVVRGKGGETLGAPETGWTALTSTWGTADVRDLPPRFVADVEGNVEWSVETAGGDARLTVTALAAPALAAAPEGGTLMARAFIDGVPVIFDLPWLPAAQGAVFRGSVVLPRGAESNSSGIEVGVFHPSWAGEARLRGAALQRAALERTEITRILTERYARFPDRLRLLSDAEQPANPADRPTAAEIVAHRHDR
jgi:hypothetical protein